MPDEIYYYKDVLMPECPDEIPEEVFIPLRDGLFQGIQVEIGYCDSYGERSIRCILPEALFLYLDTWYVSAYCHDRKGVRTFRLDRIESAHLTGVQEESHGVAADIRENGIPWDRSAAPPVSQDPSLENSAAHHHSREQDVDDHSFELMQAAEAGRIDRMSRCLENGAEINWVSVNGQTPLTAASRNGHIEAVRFLVEHGADPFLCGSDGTTALTAASRSRNFELVKYLLEELRLDVNARDHLGWTPLYCAVLDNQPELVKYYLDHGADIGSRDREKRTVLITAAHGTFTTDEQALELLKLLIDRGAEVDAQDKKGFTALFEAALQRKIKCIGFLIDSGANVLHHDRNGNSILLNLLIEYRRFNQRISVDREFEDLIHLLLGRGADLNSCNRDGTTPLMAATDDLIEYLLSLGANPSASDRSGTTVAMHHAESLNIVKLLAEYGADLRVKNQKGEDVLLLTHPSRDYIEYLIEEHGFPVDDRDHEGNTILHRACSKGYLDSVKYLIRHGADPNIRNRQGNTPHDCLDDRIYHESASDYDYEITDYLDAHEEKMTRRLFDACETMDLTEVLAAVRRGAFVNRHDGTGRTPLIVAARQYALSENEKDHNRFRQIADCLLNHGADLKDVDDDGICVLGAVILRGDPGLREDYLKKFQSCLQYDYIGDAGNENPPRKYLHLLQDYLRSLYHSQGKYMQSHDGKQSKFLAAAIEEIRKLTEE